MEETAGDPCQRVLGLCGFHTWSDVIMSRNAEIQSVASVHIAEFEFKVGGGTRTTRVIVTTPTTRYPSSFRGRGSIVGGTWSSPLRHARIDD